MRGRKGGPVRKWVGGRGVGGKGERKGGGGGEGGRKGVWRGGGCGGRDLIGTLTDLVATSTKPTLS